MIYIVCDVTLQNNQEMTWGEYDWVAIIQNNLTLEIVWYSGTRPSSNIFNLEKHTV